MAVEKTEREIGTLIGEIARGEIKLPEIQRGYRGAQRWPPALGRENSSSSR
ncbi:MAG: hypothetical protein ACRDP7_11655 [Trebonia sp.]